MTEKSIIFFDIDGTLLDFKKELPTSTKEALFALKNKGHEVAIATGRSPFMFEDLRKELEIDTYVSYNGQYVVLNGEIIHTNPIDIEPLERLTKMALENEHPVVFMDEEDMMANVPDHEYVLESFGTFELNRFPGHDPNYYIGREVYQSLLFCQDGEEAPYEEAFKDFDFIRWHPVSVDILPKGGSKAKGIKKIVDQLEIPKERQYAFGDGLNDVEMLKAVYHSVAMGNGEEEAKKAARYVTKSVEEDGIYHGLKLVGLL